MSGLAIYMEGAGDRAEGTAVLRQGMNKFLEKLKNAAQAKSWRWKLVPCGSRGDAFRAFRHALRDPDYPTAVLLVDSEGDVQSDPCTHLSSRDGWEMNAIRSNVVHLMVQSMETWIVADVAALSKYYRRNFRASALPRTQNLETISKARIMASLTEAIKETNKPRYSKIRDASNLLQLLDSAVVRARCPSCDRLFRELEVLVS